MDATNRKRTREEGADDNTELAKKQEFPINNPLKNNSYNYDDDDDDEKRYEFYDGIGVFDFPWLKEGVVFNSLEDEEEKFAPACNSYLDIESFDESSQNLCVSTNDDEVDGGDDGFWSLLVDDLDPVDNCIWRCVIDHPLDLGFNKG